MTRRRPSRGRSRRLVAGASTVAVLLLVGTGCGSAGRSTAGPAVSGARASAEVFLDRYVDADGRVVRIDQGGDTVSEGQAYAMLLDVATGERAQFARVWEWSRTNLMDPDGLLAYHWQNGRVADHNAASDADLDVARALVLAGSTWHDRSWTDQGRTYATAILDQETVTAGGKLWLVAGPWARTSPYYLDPSYLDPATFAMLTAATHDPRWARLITSSAVALSADTENGTDLPSDWATVSSVGQVQASAPPGGGTIVYGYDAFRTLVRQADGCRTTDSSQIDARLLPLAEKTAGAGDRADDYHPDGTPSQTGDNPLTLIAAAGSASAAGQEKSRNNYLDQATDLEPADGSYYFDAWVALGRYLLTTSLLAGCQL